MMAVVELLETAMPTAEFLTTHEASAFLRISKPTLERWRMEGRGPRYIKIGHRVLYPHAELERFLREHLVETAHPKRPA